MTDEKLTPERAVRLLHAKVGGLEAYVLDSIPVRPFDPMVLVADVVQFAADIAFIAQLLADHIERSERVIERLSILAEVTQPKIPWGPDHPDYDEMGQ